MISKNTKPEDILAGARDGVEATEGDDASAEWIGPYAARFQENRVPTHKFPDKSSKAGSAYQVVHDELELDGTPKLNLASFVHTWMPPEAEKLYVENMSKNLVDSDEYPATTAQHQKCVSMISNLWHAPSEEAIGTATTGSSEAIQLGGLAAKKMWQKRMKAKGKDIHSPGPNVVMGANAQVALEKFARYWDVEARLVPVTEESHYRMDPKRAMEYVDENTICVFVIMGSTYTGHYEPVKEMAEQLDEYEAKTGIYVPIHVDAASGGFVAPFATPDLEWDFRIPRVVSINASGHKFGLSYVGVGWLIYRDKAHLPEELVFELHYLGSVEYTFSLNFSRPAAPIIAQYFNFLHLGYEGYKRVAESDARNARLLARALENTGMFYIISDVHRTIEGAKNDGKITSYTPSLPVVSFRFSDEYKQKHPHVQQKWMQTLLRGKGWIIPNYELPPELSKVEILRVVIRESVSEDLVERLVCDIIEIAQSLADTNSPNHALAVLGSQDKKQKSGRRATGMQTDEHGNDSMKASQTNTYARPC